MKNIRNKERELARKIINEHREVLQILSKREQRIIELRYGLYDGREYTHGYIGEILNLSSSRVSQLEAKVRYKILKFIIT